MRGEVWRWLILLAWLLAAIGLAYLVVSVGR